MFLDHMMVHTWWKQYREKRERKNQIKVVKHWLDAEYDAVTINHIGNEYYRDSYDRGLHCWMQLSTNEEKIKEGLQISKDEFGNDMWSIVTALTNHPEQMWKPKYTIDALNE